MYNQLVDENGNVRKTMFPWICNVNVKKLKKKQNNKKKKKL